ncbi:MAG: hypothetical protein AAGC91_01150 [Pseudomonadota bacterium]
MPEHQKTIDRLQEALADVAHLAERMELKAHDGGDADMRADACAVKSIAMLALHNSGQGVQGS